MRSDKAPVTYASGKEAWPHGELVDDAPLSAHYGRQLALRLAEAMELRRMNPRGLAEASSVSASTISRILSGEVLPDLGTIPRLEAALRTDLYPTSLWRHMEGPARPG
ncbi:helix-turn-helix domain-containing protein [Actinomadura harenae]|uniref:helix-turn-helix domain-containing protein n=1 Tax=Actinomadura harenae TaxID=2483351 RepID=UPI0013153E6B|nr:helix-turn-helix transcriptional regulator [Actinomadura harenae]